MFRIFALIFISIILTYCSDSTSPDNNHFGLPTEFPLEAGNAWVYERHYYESGIDSVFLDTLFILGQYQDYYKYSWSPDRYLSLVKNFNGMFINYGIIIIGSYPDTFIYEIPTIWAFFNEDTGYVDLNKYDGYFISEDNIHISIKKDIEIFNNFYAGFVASKVDTSTNTVSREQLTTIEGFHQWIYYDLKTGEKHSETKMITKLKNFFPEINPSKTIFKRQIDLSPFRENSFIKYSDEYYR